LLSLQRLVGQDGANREPDYTVFSTGENGAALLYDTLRHMGLPVYIGYTELDDRVSIHDVYIWMEPNSLSEKDVESALHWIERGGRLILLENGGYTELDDYFNWEEAPTFGPFTHYRYGLGDVLTGDASPFLNGNLMKQSDNGQALVACLTQWNGSRIFISEWIHGYEYDDNTWTKLPGGLKIFVCQLALLALALVWFFGKRFGKPILYYEEIEREENEYIKALANLHRQAGHGAVVWEEYYGALIRTCARAFHTDVRFTAENLPSLWVEHHLPHPEWAVQIRDAVRTERWNTRKRSERKQLTRWLMMIHQMESIVQRRKN
jgi:hypothetical protein